MNLDRNRERPQDGEFASYAKPDIEVVEGDDAVDVLRAQFDVVTALLRSLSDSDVNGLTYAPGKWSFKQVIGHMADDERIFAYRAHCASPGATSGRWRASTKSCTLTLFSRRYLVNFRREPSS